MFCNGVCNFCSHPCKQKSEIISKDIEMNVQVDEIVPEISVIEQPIEIELKKNIFGKLVPRRVLP